MKAGSAIITILALSSCAAQDSRPSVPGLADRCRITQDDLIANRSLSWPAFDQQEGSPTSWRSLITAGCHESAAAVYADYLAFAPPIPGERFQTAARFHLGQSLANAGRTDEAARMIGTARREIEVGGMHWNDYVQGTVAFLTRDKPILADRQASLASQSGVSDRINAGVLAGLLHCWDRPYLEAAAPACVAASGYKVPSD